MNEQEALKRMVAPGTPRPGKYRQGVIQIHVTRACDMSCFGCTQGSNLAGRTEFISLEHFEAAVVSLKGYFGVVGVFGGNPALHPEFDSLCAILRAHVPYEQRGLWCNHPRTLEKARIMAKTFNPAVSNLNCHLSGEAYSLFKQGWPESRVVGLDQDSRHSPPFVAMKDVIEDEERIWELISGCDINQHWSAMIGVFRGELRAWFCEVAGAQAILHQDEPDYPDTGLALYDPIGRPWWTLGMQFFMFQVEKHCFDCGVPLRGYGELAQSESLSSQEQCSRTHEGVYRPKRPGRKVEVVSSIVQLGLGKIKQMTRYLQNSSL